MRRKVHTSLDEELYKQIKKLALELDINACDLLEAGMKEVITKYERGELHEYTTKCAI